MLPSFPTLSCGTILPSSRHCPPVSELTSEPTSLPGGAGVTALEDGSLLRGKGRGRVGGGKRKREREREVEWEEEKK